MWKATVQVGTGHRAWDALSKDKTDETSDSSEAALVAAQ